MRKLSLLIVLAACDAASFNVASESSALEEGDPCGDCNAGTWNGLECVYPSAGIDLVNGGVPADTGPRQVFHTESYAGAVSTKINKAGQDAAAVGGAVIIDQVYEVTKAVFLYDGVMYTGGGLRRACMPVSTATVAAAQGDPCVTVDSVAGQVANSGNSFLVNTGPGMDDTLGTIAVTSIDTANSKLCRLSGGLQIAIPAGAKIFPVFSLARTYPTESTGGIIVDSVLFDGSNDCNSATHDWRYNNTLPFRGYGNTVRNSVFYDTPSENLTICRSNVQNNIAVDLQGSLVHKSCSINPTDDTGIDYIEGNYVENANIGTDEVVGHSEGVITFSAQSHKIFATRNVFRYGAEGAFGLMGTDDEDVGSLRNCYAHFPRVIEFGANTDQSSFRSVDDTLIDIGP